tara:strand:- start:6699 stop:6992 length:294 start_codon:yes stop_codon:yes gene_type:complete
MDDDIEKKLADLESRIDKVREKDRIEEAQITEKRRVSKGSRAGSEFLASIIAGFVLGYIIDRFADTAPLAMLFFMMMGFVSGIYRANAVLQKNNKEP